VGDERDSQGQYDRGQQEPQQEALKGIAERVVADIPVELGVPPPERHSVHPQQPGAPTIGRARPGDHSEDRRDDQQNQQHVGFDCRPVAFQVLLLGGQWTDRWPQLVAEYYVRSDGRRHHSAEQHEQQDAGVQDRAEDLAEVDRPEKEQVRVQPDEDPEEHDQQDEHDEHRDQQPGTRQQRSAGSSCHGLLRAVAGVGRLPALHGNLRHRPVEEIGEDGL
jgi:hypothetical protein